LNPADPFCSITPKVLAEWWFFANKFHALHAFVPTIAETVELVEWHGPMARYKLVTTRSIGDLFATVEQNKDAMGVLEYSISATTLEQIFNNFARHQESQDDLADGPKIRGEDMSVYLQVAQNTPLPPAVPLPAEYEDGSLAQVAQGTPLPGVVSLGSAVPENVGAVEAPGVVVVAAVATSDRGASPPPSQEYIATTL